MTTRTHTPGISAPGGFSLPGGMFRRSRFGGLVALLGLARQRRALSRLDDRALQDIGVTREAAQREAERPIWDVPNHWAN